MNIGLSVVYEKIDSYLGYVVIWIVMNPAVSMGSCLDSTNFKCKQLWMKVKRGLRSF